MARVLVLGGAGLLGQYVCAEARDRGSEVVATRRVPGPPRPGIAWHELDVRERDAVRNLVREVSPETVVNAAALTDVDGCEDRSEEAHAVNALAPAALAGACKASGARFVHVSTDYVFDGTQPATEKTPPSPLGVYGRTKADGERRVLDVNPNSLVLRMSSVFGWNRLSAKMNAVTWILAKVEAGQDVPLFRDQRLTPTYAKTGAQAALDLASLGASGLFHVASKDCLTRHEMGEAVVEAFGIPGAKLVPVAMSSVALRAPRPPAPCLVVKKVEETLKRSMPRFRDCLEDMRETR